MVQGEEKQQLVSLRLTIRLYEDEYPVLIEDLLRARKGQRRAARLATLATIGLVAERNAMGIRTESGSAPAETSRGSALPQERTIVARGDMSGLTDDDVTDLFGGTTLRES